MCERGGKCLKVWDGRGREKWTQFEAHLKCWHVYIDSLLTLFPLPFLCTVSIYTFLRTRSRLLAPPLPP